MEQKLRKPVAWLLTLAMIFTMLPGFTFTALAADNLCEHHTEHTAACGYVEGVSGVGCAHTHDDTCGYAEVVVGVECTCEDTNENGVIIHIEGCGYMAPVDAVACQHTHDDACGYVEAVEASPCTYECALCALTEITAWSWIDEWEIIDPDTGVVALPGASERTPAYFDDIVSMLPVEINATVEGGEETVALEGWACPGYPEGGAYSGNYIFTAALPESYVLGLGTPELAVTVELGGAAVYADSYGLNVTGDGYRRGADVMEQNGDIVNSSNSTAAVIMLDNGADVIVTGEGHTYQEVINANGAGNYGEVIYVPAGVKNAKLTLNGATINAGAATAPITVAGELELTLKGENTLNCFSHHYDATNRFYVIQTPGIFVLPGGKLTINGTDTAKLNITANDGAAAIGGSFGYTENVGEIIINGGTLDLTSNGNATYGGGAAIGCASGNDKDFTSITINGGFITAKSELGAAIGTGAKQNASTGTITINGGTIDATGGEYGHKWELKKSKRSNQRTD